MISILEMLMYIITNNITNSSKNISDCLEIIIYFCEQKRLNLYNFLILAFISIYFSPSSLMVEQ